MAQEHEQLVDAALDLDSAIHQKASAAPQAGDVPEDVTDVPVQRSLSAARPDSAPVRK